jgi:acid-sensing ion channel, other
MQKQIASAKIKLKVCWQTIKKTSIDYANHSTIHGVSYITERDRSWIERVWWIVVLCFSFFVCGKLIFDAWNISPIIISFTEKPIQMWQIPFPAVTICPRTFAQSDRINITELIDYENSRLNLYANFTDEE